MAPTENDGFLGGSKTVKVAEGDSGKSRTCLMSKGCLACAVVSGCFGALLIVVGLVAAFAGESALRGMILKSMALTVGSDRTESWLRPPVQPYLWGYAFHVTNPQHVLQGRKPILEERGPYVYKSVTVKDSDDNMVWHDDGTLTYRQRKIYTYVPELSGEGLDPKKDMITVPNIPLWTGLNSIRDKEGYAKDIARGLVVDNGLGTPFVTVSFDGLLWGYEDELPCLKLDLPSECGSDDGDPFGSDGGDNFGDEDEDDDAWGDWDKKRRRRSTTTTTDGMTAAEEKEAKRLANIESDERSEYCGQAKPKAEFVNCTCNWGLFRDRNVTMRKPIRFFTGVSDLALKGVVTEYDGKKELGWWKKGSECDAVGGQDSSTLPPGLTEASKPTVFIDLMCRGLPMEFEKYTEHAGIRSLRFIPPANAMGAHDDSNPERRNPDNECYCLKDEKFKCFKSGVLNMEPCKRELKAPLALSMPHFYQAHPSFREAVGGMSPEKEKHEFYMDIVPEFGFPLAIRPRFQLNVLVGSGVDPDWSIISGMREEIVLPFLWAQDGFSEPSESMAADIAFGLAAPDKLPVMAGVVCFALGGALLLGALGYAVWRRSASARARSGGANDSNHVAS